MNWPLFLQIIGITQGTGGVIALVGCALNENYKAVLICAVFAYTGTVIAALGFSL